MVGTVRAYICPIRSASWRCIGWMLLRRSGENGELVLQDVLQPNQQLHAGNASSHGAGQYTVCVGKHVQTQSRGWIDQLYQELAIANSWEMVVRGSRRSRSDESTPARTPRRCHRPHRAGSSVREAERASPDYQPEQRAQDPRVGRNEQGIVLPAHCPLCDVSPNARAGPPASQTALAQRAPSGGRPSDSTMPRRVPRSWWWQARRAEDEGVEKRARPGRGVEPARRERIGRREFIRICKDDER